MSVFLILSILISLIELGITIECEKPCELTSDSVSCKWNSLWNNSNIISKAKNCLETSNYNELSLVLAKNTNINKELLQSLTSVVKLSFEEGNKIVKLHPEAFRSLYNLQELNLQNTGVQYIDILNALPAIRDQLKVIRVGQTGTKCNCDWFLLKKKLEELNVKYQDPNNPNCDDYDEAQNKKLCFNFSQTAIYIYQREVVRVNRAVLCFAVIIILFACTLMFAALLCALSKPFNFKNNYLEGEEEEAYDIDRLNCTYSDNYDLQGSHSSRLSNISPPSGWTEGEMKQIAKTLKSNGARSTGHLTIATPGSEGPRIRVASKAVKVDNLPSKNGALNIPLSQSAYCYKPIGDHNQEDKLIRPTRNTIERNTYQSGVDLNLKIDSRTNKSFTIEKTCGGRRLILSKANSFEENITVADSCTVDDKRKITLSKERVSP
ncbi:unnamed protein product [Dimorphilus gyrociliatus]|uniref:Uncharacterized protein n=1 Tax=Dimorphilus gyrociliatus TaxID=2664684 RepID=A0A7I8W530_9ANNE|nr:unnamed protein product [Dimorphilus gyrociliatus]